MLQLYTTESKQYGTFILVIAWKWQDNDTSSFICAFDNFPINQKNMLHADPFHLSCHIINLLVAWICQHFNWEGRKYDATYVHTLRWKTIWYLYLYLLHFYLKYVFTCGKPWTSVKMHGKVLLSLAAGMEEAERLWQIHHTWGGGHLSWGKWHYSCRKFRQIVLKWASWGRQY